MTNSRQIAERKGRRAETLAAIALMLKGYSIKARRYKTKLGEIDIIAKRGDLIVLVEVKARGTIEDAHHSVSFEAAQRIEAAGDIWLSKQKNAHLLSVRRDLMAVLPRRWPIHVPNAF